jgi:hypothetical protein
MNPCVVFNNSGRAFIARLKPASVEHLKDPVKFSKMLTTLSEELDVDLLSGGFKALPIGDELQGRWLTGSPLGQEFSDPPYSWMFEERIALAFTSDIHPLVIFDVYWDDDWVELKIPHDRREGLGKIITKSIIAEVFGDDALVNIEMTKVSTVLDEALDGMWGNFDGGYG